ncbi:MAG: NAD(P)/FAD-dependent oxidoreductase [Crocosphaera sp.]
MVLSNTPIAIVGHSLTAHAVAAALQKLGYECTLIYDPTSLQFKGPSLVLNDVCETLLGELFGQSPLSEWGQPLTYRWVRWGNDASEQVYQPAHAVPSHVLLSQIRQSDIMQSVSVVDARKITTEQLLDNYAWTVFCTHQQGLIYLPSHKSQETLFPPLSGGKRMILTAESPHDCLELRNSCYIESLANSWLFYAPLDEQLGMVQACLPTFPANPQKALLECLYQSRLIGPLVKQIDQVRCFPSAPRLQWPLYGSRWLMAGEPTIKLDPVSGEGTPFALRSGILAAAVVDGILQNPNNLNSLLNYYQTRLTHSFIAHLEGCSQYYQSVFGNHPLWQREISQMIELAEDLSSRVQQPTESNLNYQLIGFKLVLRDF